MRATGWCNDCIRGNWDKCSDSECPCPRSKIRQDAIRSELEAERDALKADAERLRTQLKGKVCEVCWTSSWAPCGDEDKDAVFDSEGGVWIQCQMCFAHSEVMRLTAERDQAYTRGLAAGKVEESTVRADERAKVCALVKELFGAALEAHVLYGVEVADALDAVQRVARAATPQGDG